MRTSWHYEVSLNYSAEHLRQTDLSMLVVRGRARAEGGHCQASGTGCLSSSVAGSFTFQLEMGWTLTWFLEPCFKFNTYYSILAHISAMGGTYDGVRQRAKQIIMLTTTLSAHVSLSLNIIYIIIGEKCLNWSGKLLSLLFSFIPHPYNFASILSCGSVSKVFLKSIHSIVQKQLFSSSNIHIQFFVDEISCVI